MGETRGKTHLHTGRVWLARAERGPCRGIQEKKGGKEIASIPDSSSGSTKNELRCGGRRCTLFWAPQPPKRTLHGCQLEISLQALCTRMEDGV